MTVTFADHVWPLTGQVVPGFWCHLCRALGAWAHKIPAPPRRAPNNVGEMAGQDTGLRAVADYAQFLAAHPDMPNAHRERILTAMIRCCEDMRASDG